MLLLLIALVLMGGLLAGLAGRFSNSAPRWVALAVLLLATVFTIELWLSNLGPIYAVTNFAWIPRFGITVYLSLDGLSLMLVLLTLFLGMVAVVASWTEIVHRSGFFQFNLLWTIAGVIGVFTALDLFLFFLFWEVMLVPMYFLIAIWGHEQRGFAAMKFFLFTQISGLLMLLAIVTLVYQHHTTNGALSFNYQDLLNVKHDPKLELWIMLGFLIAFLVKLPAVPFHTWLPDAHTQAPTAGSVILAGIMLKTGAYGIIRFVVPLFPDAVSEIRWLVMLIGALSVIYGGYMAFSQSDFKRLVAYSSVSHMGFVLIGIFAWNHYAVQGAVVVILAHGFASAALFMLAGALQERLHSREMTQMGGLWQFAPRMGAVTLFFVIASLGMPGLGTFVGEFLVLLGAFQVDVAITVAAATGMVFAAVYSLVLMQRSFFGPVGMNVKSIPDFGMRELSVMVLMALALVWLGIYPQPVLDLATPTIQSLSVGSL